MTPILPADIIRDVMRLASCSNKEICGLISQDYEVIPIDNVSLYPESEFVMDKVQYLKTITQLCNEERGVLCLYHSHVSSGPDPSQADLAFMRRSLYPMLIVSPKGYRVVDHAA